MVALGSMCTFRNVLSRKQKLKPVVVREELIHPGIVIRNLLILARGSDFLIK